MPASRQAGNPPNDHRCWLLSQMAAGMQPFAGISYLDGKHILKLKKTFCLPQVTLFRGN